MQSKNCGWLHSNWKGLGLDRTNRGNFIYKNEEFALITIYRYEKRG